MRVRLPAAPRSYRVSLIAAILIAPLRLPAQTPVPAPIRAEVPRRLTQTGPCAGNTEFHVGAGMADITGPAAEAGMMGYGKPQQETEGIHTRLRARAFVVHTPCNGRRVAFVSADLGQLFQGVKQQVVERLRARFGGLYQDDNVLLSATHTHSGPGGYSHYALYNITSLGYDPQNFEAIVDGITTAIVRANGELRAGRILVNSGDLAGASRNRADSATYRANPELAALGPSEAVDRLMTVLRFQHADGREIGAIAWFAVHNTSMSGENRLISGDNKGYASYLFERAMGTNYRGSKGFVAAFAQSNEGDVSPNLASTPDGRSGSDSADTRRSGLAQYTRARALYDAATRPLVGGVEYRHAYVRMDHVEVAAEWTGSGTYPTCPAAIGLSMLAGAVDGPGVGERRVRCSDLAAIWKFVTCPGIAKPCQGQKPVVFEMGTQKPYPWTPEVLPLQVVAVGNLAILAIPFEATTTAGRRLRQTTLARLAPAGIDRVVIAGLANAYAGYVTTHEEYARQDYEGASTHFGPWTLAAVQQEMATLAEALRDGVPAKSGLVPRDLRGQQTSLRTGVVLDDKPPTVAFGAVVRDANPAYRPGNTVRVTFWSGHPKNNLRREGSFLEVQRLDGNAWTGVAWDWDWETIYRWKRVDCPPVDACSQVTVEWTIPDSTQAGTYRIRHDGDWKSGVTGRTSPYSGHSRKFIVEVR